MPNPKKSEDSKASKLAQARLTPAEHAALTQLLTLRAAEHEARSEPGDASFAGWLRWIIRREAKAAGISLDGTPPPAQAPAKPRAKPRAA